MLSAGKFKRDVGGKSGFQVAEAMQVGAKRALPDATLIPLPVADGGDDTLAILLKAKPGDLHHAEVTGQLGEKVQERGFFLLLDTTYKIPLCAL